MASTIVTSIVSGGSNNHATVSEEANAYATDFVSQGIVGAIGNTSGAAPSTGGFGVSQDASPDMGVTVNSGVAYITGTPSGQGSQVLRARMTANYTAYTINANASGSTKYDWVYLSFSAANASNPSSSADNVITLFTSRSSSNVSDNGTPPTYGLLLAVVTVANGASSITNANISDRRVQSAISNSTTTSTTGWQTLNAALTYGSNTGNKEFTVTATGDLTSTLSPGMKLRIPRAVTPPTQCMSFTAASSQYAAKSSPSGITFTGAFTCEAWVYLNSYTTTGVIGRDTGSGGGFGLYINVFGYVSILYRNGTGTTQLDTYQSIPLKQWVHIAGVVTSVSSKTAVIYVNGTAVPGSFSGSAATSLVQSSTDLRISGLQSLYLDGYVSEARVWSAAQSQAQIQANMAINLVGNETNLVALFQGNGNFNDATSNANNLTQSGGAVATQASNPYNANEYAFVTKVSYSNPTTTLTLFTGDNGSLPNSTLGVVSYSVVKIPYGFPSLRNWRVFVPYCTQVSTALNATTGQMGGVQIVVPTGEWRLSMKLDTIITAASRAFLEFQIFLSTATNANTGVGIGAITASSSTASSQSDTPVSISGEYTATSATTIYLDATTNGNDTVYYTANATRQGYLEAYSLYV